MSLLVDLFGYLGIVLHGLTITAQSLAVGGVLFLVAVARPFAATAAGSASVGAVAVGAALDIATPGSGGRDAIARRAGRAAAPATLPPGPAIRHAAARIAAWSALALVLCDGLNLAMQSAVLIDTLGIPLPDALGADYAVAGLVKIAAAGLLAVLLFLPRRTPAAILLALCAVELAAATMTTHAAARLSDNSVLLGVEFLHQLGAAVWIGAIPCFVMALNRVDDLAGWRWIGPRFSRISLAGVGCILVSGITMGVFYIGSPSGLYGTAYGVMVCAKVAMFLMLLGLGYANSRVTARLARGDRNAAVPRMKRFAEVEIGIGITIFFTAASLTSVPPAIDLVQDRVTFHEIVERNTPQWPVLRSPDHNRLAIPALQQKLDAEAAAHAAQPLPAFVEGGGELPPRNADDILWSEYNHHWSGLFVLALGLLALIERAGVRWARHWPLVFLGLGGFLLVRSDPEVWPIGAIGWFDAFRDVEVVQHRLFVVVIVVFALFEWAARTGRLRSPRAALVFPLMCAAGSALLFTHSHAIANVKDQLLIELTHTPIALGGIVAGWSRWLQLRLPPGRATRGAGWVWPMCFVLIGAALLLYREA
jgi:putative copper resistance protein D